ncbi:hypothetical protein KI387_042398, partial [Taxus chinensis]
EDSDKPEPNQLLHELYPENQSLKYTMMETHLCSIKAVKQFRFYIPPQLSLSVLVPRYDVKSILTQQELEGSKRGKL